jgi:hypothetical protein
MRRCWVRIAAETKVFLNKVFWGLPMSLKTNWVSSLGYYRLLLNPFSFIRRYTVRILEASQNTRRHMPEYGIFLNTVTKCVSVNKFRDIQDVHFAGLPDVQNILSADTVVSSDKMKGIHSVITRSVNQCYAIECYRSFCCVVLCVFMTVVESNQPARWTPGT